MTTPVWIQVGRGAVLARVRKEPMPLVSVIIPVHDAGGFLDSCLESVRRQTHHDLQVICVDDGSGDQSAAVLEQHTDVDCPTADDPAAERGDQDPHATSGWRTRSVTTSCSSTPTTLFPRTRCRDISKLSVSSTSDFSTGRVVRMAGSHSLALRHARTRPDPPGVPRVTSFGTRVSCSTPRRGTSFSAVTTGPSHRFAFPEQVLFEDVALMTEAHCRAALRRRPGRRRLLVAAAR